MWVILPHHLSPCELGGHTAEKEKKKWAEHSVGVNAVPYREYL